MRFEWDPFKNEASVRKHGIPFETAQEVFDDPLHLSVRDLRFTYFEERWITVGLSRMRHLVVVAHLSFDQDGEGVIRIISAREATLNERKQYEEL